jgi:hypothetical protein
MSWPLSHCCSAFAQASGTRCGLCSAELLLEASIVPAVCVALTALPYHHIDLYFVPRNTAFQSLSNVFTRWWIPLHPDNKVLWPLVGNTNVSPSIHLRHTDESYELVRPVIDNDDLTK